MAESLALVASFATIVDLTTKIAACCKLYITSVKDARKDLRKVLVETTSLQTIVDNFRFLLDHDPDFDGAELDAIRGPISSCLESLQKLQKLIPAPEDDASTCSRLTLRQRSKAIVTRLAWPLKRDTVMSTLSDIQRDKATMSLSICGDISRDVKTVKNQVVEIRQMLTDSEQMSFLNWMCSVNPSDLHNRACGLYEDGTGTWVLRHPNWADWTDLHNQHSRILWISGIPGCGKTVLASYLFLEIVSLSASGTISPADHPLEDPIGSQLRQNQSPSIACIYYYCHHTRNHDETPHFLRWVVSQLCRKSNVIPNALLQLFRQHCQPNISHLISALEQCIAPYDTVFIVLDAIDESVDREALLLFLKDFAMDVRFARIRLLATSRIYPDIGAIMSEISVPISMSNPFVEDDIRKYVKATIQRRRFTTYRHLSDEFLHHACDVLTSNSHGMFQWAVCQLDTIRRLRWRSESSLREALLHLPEDLYATYERIFKLILDEFPEDSQLVVDSLTWITYNSELLKTKSMPLHTLLSAIHTADGEHQTRKSPRVQIEQLVELLGCLVQVHNYGQERREDDFDCAEHDKHSLGYISLSHYTIGEFLTDRICKSSAAAFSLWERSIFFRTLLQQALQVDFDSETYVPHRCSLSHYVIVAAVTSVSRWGRRMADNAELAQLVFNLFTPDASHWRAVEKSLAAEHEAAYDRITDDSFSYFWLSKVDPNYEVTSTARAIYSLMCLLDLKQWDLASALLSLFSKQSVSTRDENLLSTRVSWTISTYIEGSEAPSGGIAQYAFEGTLPEWAAVFTAVVDQEYCYQPFEFLFRNHSVSFVRQTPGILLSVLFAHKHIGKGLLNPAGPESFMFCRPPVCMIAELVDCGASLEAPGYLVTPLQVAVVQSDYVAIKILLAAGAQVNNTGTAKGFAFSTNNPLSQFNFLHGATPLHICRQHSERAHLPCGHLIEHDHYGSSHDIERLLLEYGGEDFRASMPDQVANFEVVDDDVGML